jgi:hypothetical protein
LTCQKKKGKEKRQSSRHHIHETVTTGMKTPPISPFSRVSVSGYGWFPKGIFKSYIVDQMPKYDCREAQTRRMTPEQDRLSFWDFSFLVGLIIRVRLKGPTCRKHSSCILSHPNWLAGAGGGGMEGLHICACQCASRGASVCVCGVREVPPPGNVCK